MNNSIERLMPYINHHTVNTLIIQYTPSRQEYIDTI
jgi:hypothetical protein